MRPIDMVPFVQECLRNTLEEMHEAWQKDPEKYFKMKVTMPEMFSLKKNAFTEEPLELGIIVRRGQ